MNTLSLIPEDASVTASTFYTTALSQRELLYDLRHCSQEHLLSTDYIVLDPSAESDFKAYASPGRDNGCEALTLRLEKQGYEPYAEAGDLIILHRNR